MLKKLKFFFRKKIQIKLTGFKLSVSIVDPRKEIQFKIQEAKDLVCDLQKHLINIQNNYSKIVENNLKVGAENINLKSLSQDLGLIASQFQEAEGLKNQALGRIDEALNSVKKYSRHKPLSFKSFFLSIFWIIPKRYREEYVGELLENRVHLKKRGVPKCWINVITIWNFLAFLSVSRWEWFQDLVTSVFESIKELIR